MVMLLFAEKETSFIWVFYGDNATCEKNRILVPDEQVCCYGEFSFFLCLSLQEVVGVQKPRTAKQIKACGSWGEAFGVGSSQYGRYSATNVSSYSFCAV